MPPAMPVRRLANRRMGGLHVLETRNAYIWQPVQAEHLSLRLPLVNANQIAFAVIDKRHLADRRRHRLDFKSDVVGA